MSRRLFAQAAAGAVLGRAEDPSEEARRVFGAGNLERRKRRLPELVWDDGLAGEAGRHSQRMASLGYFGHRDPERGNLGERLRNSGVGYTSYAENLYMHSGPGDAAMGAVKSWMRSRGQRSNLLRRAMTRTGTGVAPDGRGRRVVTQILAGGP